MGAKEHFAREISKVKDRWQGCAVIPANAWKNNLPLQFSKLCLCVMTQGHAGPIV